MEKGVASEGLGKGALLASDGHLQRLHTEFAHQQLSRMEAVVLLRSCGRVSLPTMKDNLFSRRGRSKPSFRALRQSNPRDSGGRASFLSQHQKAPC